MRRREFISLIGGAAVTPFAALAQSRAMPTIGFLDPTSPEARVERLRGFRLGLKDAGYVEGENIAIEYRWAEGRYDRLPALAADLARRPLAAIAAGTYPAARAAGAATKTIPVVFGTGEDPVVLGLVTSLARPSGNLTGINFFSGELVEKRLSLLRELLPAANRVAVLVNPAGPGAEITLRGAESAGRAMGLQIQVVRAGSIREIDAAFATVVQERCDALYISNDPIFTGRRVQLVTTAVRHAIPTIASTREYSDVGGLMSYGTNFLDTYRQIGVYTGRILKGAKVADLPVVQSDKFELVINHQIARLLGLIVPPSLLARADEVIE